MIWPAVFGEECFDGLSCLLATRGVLEILGLDPTNPRRNTSKSFFELLQRGNIVEMHFRFIPSCLAAPMEESHGAGQLSLDRPMNDAPGTERL